MQGPCPSEAAPFVRGGEEEAAALHPGPSLAQGCRSRAVRIGFLQVHEILCHAPSAGWDLPASPPCSSHVPRGGAVKGTVGLVLLAVGVVSGQAVGQLPLSEAHSVAAQEGQKLGKTRSLATSPLPPLSTVQPSPSASCRSPRTRAQSALWGASALHSDCLSCSQTGSQHVAGSLQRFRPWLPGRCSTCQTLPWTPFIGV